ncbi:hypothetical protein QYF36_024663 [Acer negundo]|nr:hypothetical protein QYF36_024663 [Acer negundo]
MTIREPLPDGFVTEALHRTEHHPPSSSSKVQKFISAVFAKFDVSMKKTASSSLSRTTTNADDDKTTQAQEVNNDKSVIDETEENDDVFYTLGRNSTADYKKSLMNSSLENGIDFLKEDVSSDKQGGLADLIDWGSTEEANDDVFYALQHHINPSWAIIFRGPVDYEPLYSQGSSLPHRSVIGSIKCLRK